MDKPCFNPLNPFQKVPDNSNTDPSPFTSPWESHNIPDLSSARYSDQRDLTLHPFQKPEPVCKDQRYLDFYAKIQPNNLFHNVSIFSGEYEECPSCLFFAFQEYIHGDMDIDVLNAFIDLYEQYHHLEGALALINEYEDTILSIALSAEDKKREVIIHLYERFPDILIRELKRFDTEGNTMLLLAIVKGESTLRDIISLYERYADMEDSALEEVLSTGWCLAIAVNKTEEDLQAVVDLYKNYPEALQSLLEKSEYESERHREPLPSLLLAAIYKGEEMFNIIIKLYEEYAVDSLDAALKKGSMRIPFLLSRAVDCNNLEVLQKFIDLYEDKYGEILDNALEFARGNGPELLSMVLPLYNRTPFSTIINLYQKRKPNLLYAELSNESSILLKAMRGGEDDLNLILGLYSSLNPSVLASLLNDESLLLNAISSGEVAFQIIINLYEEDQRSMVLYRVLDRARSSILSAATKAGGRRLDTIIRLYRNHYPKFLKEDLQEQFLLKNFDRRGPLQSVLSIYREFSDILGEALQSVISIYKAFPDILSEVLANDNFLFDSVCNGPEYLESVLALYQEYPGALRKTLENLNIHHLFEALSAGIEVLKRLLALYEKEPDALALVLKQLHPCALRSRLMSHLSSGVVEVEEFRLICSLYEKYPETLLVILSAPSLEDYYKDPFLLFTSRSERRDLFDCQDSFLSLALDRGGDMLDYVLGLYAQYPSALTNLGLSPLEKAMTKDSEIFKLIVDLYELNPEPLRYILKNLVFKSANKRKRDNRRERTCLSMVLHKYPEKSDMILSLYRKHLDILVNHVDHCISLEFSQSYYIGILAVWLLKNLDAHEFEELFEKLNFFESLISSQSLCDEITQEENIGKYPLATLKYIHMRLNSNSFNTDLSEKIEKIQIAINRLNIRGLKGAHKY